MNLRRFLLLLVAPLLLAASQRELGLDEVADLSTEVVVGRVVASESRWQGRLIVTVTTVDVLESLKGAPGGPRVEVTQLGGRAPHPRTGVVMDMSASTFAALDTGQEVVLFLHRGKGGLRQLVGGPQGRLVVRENPKTRVREIPVGAKQLNVAGDAVEVGPMTLDTLRERVRSRAGRTP